MNNYIKSIVIKYLFGKRCPKCYSAYDNNSFIISTQVGFTSRLKHFIRKPIHDMPLMFDERAILASDDYFYSHTRDILWVDKFRVNIPVISIEIHCKKCYNIKFVEIEHSHIIA